MYNHPQQTRVFLEIYSWITQSSPAELTTENLNHLVEKGAWAVVGSLEDEWQKRMRKINEGEIVNGETVSQS